MVGQTADTSGKNKKRHRWLARKPERRHSVELETLDEQDHRPYRYVLKRERFYSKCPDAKGISLEHVEIILRYIVQQRIREQKEENLEHEKRESEIRRQSELPTDLTGKLRRVTPVDPIISPFDSGEDKTPLEDTYIPPWSPKCPSTPNLVPKDTPQPSPVVTPEESPIPSPRHSPTRPFQTPTPTKSPETLSSPFMPKCLISCQASTNSGDFVDSDSDFTMTISTKKLVEALTKTLKNINQSPTIPLPVFKGKKGEDPEDHILKVEDYFGVHQITEQDDKIKRFKDTLFETARK